MQQQQQPQQSPGAATPSSASSQTTVNSGGAAAATAAATASVSGNTSTPIRIGSAKHAGGGDSLAPPLGNVNASSHSVPGTPQQQPQSSSVPTASGSHLQLQNSGALSMAASNQSLGVSVGAGSSISGINITPPNSAGLRQSSGEFAIGCIDAANAAADCGAGDQDTSSSLASIAFQCRVVPYRIVSCFVLCCLYTLCVSLSLSMLVLYQQLILYSLCTMLTLVSLLLVIVFVSVSF